VKRPAKITAPRAFPMVPPERSGPPWHQGKTFYSCGGCCAQSELGPESLAHPLALDCWQCGAPGSMHQWVPPQVALERKAAAGG
jgi:hypothetical protein